MFKKPQMSKGQRKKSWIENIEINNNNNTNH